MRCDDIQRKVVDLWQSNKTEKYMFRVKFRPKYRDKIQINDDIFI